MQSFLAYVARQYGRKKEDVATDTLKYILDQYEPARTTFVRFVAERGHRLPEIYAIESRTRGPHGVPDLLVFDGRDSCCAIVENKFWAPLTPKQPMDYFARLRDDGGLILFFVPQVRVQPLWNDLRELCEKAGRPMEQLPGKRFSAMSRKDCLCVASWKQLLDGLDTSLENMGSHDPEALVFINQLRRVCEVAENEVFGSLSPHQIDGGGISTLIRHLTSITRELIDRCIDQNVVQTTTDSKRSKNYEVRADVDSSLFLGQALLICGVHIWMGFWALAWEEVKTSPLWISLDPRDPDVNKFVKRLHGKRGESAVITRRLYGDQYWLIPIPIMPGISQGQVVDEAFRFVADLKASIDGREEM